jgi:hypothetical protein
MPCSSHFLAGVAAPAFGLLAVLPATPGHRASFLLLARLADVCQGLCEACPDFGEGYRHGPPAATGHVRGFAKPPKKYRPPTSSGRPCCLALRSRHDPHDPQKATACSEGAVGPQATAQLRSKQGQQQQPRAREGHQQQQHPRAAREGGRQGGRARRGQRTPTRGERGQPASKTCLNSVLIGIVRRSYQQCPKLRPTVKTVLSCAFCLTVCLSLCLCRS